MVTNKWIATAATAAMVLAVAACGDDDESAAAPSTAAFCGELESLDQGGDDAGPYDDFYGKHPEPTPADWAADGHLVTEALDASIDDIEGVRPSEEGKPQVEAVLAALETIKQNSIDVVSAAEDGDQDAIDELERVNQDENVPALMEAMQSIEEMCVSADGS